MPIWKEDSPLDPAIAAARTAEATITVTDAAGKPAAGAAVVVRQKTHRFRFGCNAFYVLDADEQRQDLYRRRFRELLNFATLPFYWGHYEKQPGQTRRDELMQMAQWCRDNGVAAKGHPLCWHEAQPAWTLTLGEDEVLRLQLQRIRDIVSGFRGLIDTWDVLNEAVVMPDFAKANPITPLCRRLGAVGLIQRCFAAAREANPAATLLLNDYMPTEAYERLIEQCLAADVSIDVIGIQSHMHEGPWAPGRVEEVCGRFSRFGLPIHFTELSMVSGGERPGMRFDVQYDDWPTTDAGEAEQCWKVVEFYKRLLAWPRVEAITWWDLPDGRWLKAPSGLIRADYSPKPAYLALQKLIHKDWWIEKLELRTDDAGRTEFRGWLGKYEIEANGSTKVVELTKGGTLAMELHGGNGNNDEHR